MSTAKNRAAAERKTESRRAERNFCPPPLEREKPSAMTLTPGQWDALRVAAINGDKVAFEVLVGEIARTIARDEVARRTQRRQGAYVGGKPYLITDR